MSYFSVAPLRPDEETPAYAAVRLLAPEVPPDLWTAFLESCGFGEVLALRGPDGSIFGLASFRIEPSSPNERVMLIDNFWTIELSRSAPGRSLLTSELERIAWDQGCARVRQLIGCAGQFGLEDGPLRNHLAVSDSRTGISFNKGADCSCGNLPSRTASEMYPER